LKYSNSSNNSESSRQLAIRNYKNRIRKELCSRFKRYYLVNKWLKKLNELNNMKKLILLLICFGVISSSFSMSFLFWKKHKPPPSYTYTTNYTKATAYWNPVLGTTVYNLQYGTNSILTFSTNVLVQQLMTNSIYPFKVRDSDTNNLWSYFSSIVYFGTTSNITVYTTAISTTMY
jgi:hypothetical protein